jgi:hypothetical protein
MRITPNISLKKLLIKKYWKETRKVLIKMRQQVVDAAEHSDPETLRLMLPHLLQSQPMVDHLLKIWGEVGGRFAFETNQKLNRNKSDNPVIEFKDEQSNSNVSIVSTVGVIPFLPRQANEKLIDYQRRMRAYAYERSLLKANKIRTTEQEAINRVITSVIERASAEGLSIPNTRNLMKEALDNELVTIENWEAERIARTEVNGAANTGSFEAAREEGTEDVTKEWITSGLPNIRDSHLEYEALGAVEFDYEYAPGLQFPGDETGEPEEIINCRCTYVLDTVT